MKCSIRGVFVFLTAFMIGLTAAPPPIPDIPPISDEVVITTPVDCYLKSDPQPETPDTELTIVIRRHDPDFEFEERSIAITPAVPRHTVIDLDLGESIENQLILLHPLPYQMQEYMIEQQFETSMAIGDEGPHYDMTHWKHYTSPWREIRSVARNRFLTSRLSESDNIRFPKVTSAQIVEAFRKDGADKRWLNLARTCSGPNSGPCYISVSRISLRISVKENDRWQPVHTLDFTIPMGC